MLAQRNWFSFTRGIPWPSHWKAWAYFGAWGSFLTIPWVILVARHHFPESLIWPWVVVGLMFWDLRSSFRSAPKLSNPESAEPPLETIETANYLVRRR